MIAGEAEAQCPAINGTAAVVIDGNVGGKATAPVVGDGVVDGTATSGL